MKRSAEPLRSFLIDDILKHSPKRPRSPNDFLNRSPKRPRSPIDFLNNSPHNRSTRSPTDTLDHSPKRSQSPIDILNHSPKRSQSPIDIVRPWNRHFSAIPHHSSNHGDNGNSPLDALFELASKALDRVNKEKTSSHSRHADNGMSQVKKKRKSRTAFTNHQIFELEKRFLYQKYLSPADRDELASGLGLTGAQVITWFQNRRAKLKRDVEEIKKDVEATKMNFCSPIQSTVLDLQSLVSSRNRF